MKRVVQRMVVCALSVAMLFTGVPFMAMGDGGEQGGPFGVQEVSAASNTVNPGPTEEEVQKYLKNNNVTWLHDDTFDEEPAKPDTPGKLSEASQQDALKLLNAIRYVAGLDAAILDDEFIDLQQHAAFVLWNIGRLTHYPIRDGYTQPTGMRDSVWQKGDAGAGKANLAREYNDSLSVAIFDWLSDAGSNMTDVGHRRWALNPVMGKTGFGAADNFYAMYSPDSSNTSGWDTTNVIWPAQNTPVQFFSIRTADAWSLCTGARETKENIDVTLTCTAGSKHGTTWTFDGATAYDVRVPGDYMNVSNVGAGMNGCIIFRPGDVTKYLPGDTYDVQITGTTKGTISYTVKFINGYPITSLSIPESIILEPEESRTLKAEVLPAEAQGFVKGAWESSDKNVATVDDNGKVTAVGNGTADITCTMEGKTDTCAVNVTTRISLTDANITKTVGNATYTGKAENPPIVVKNEATGEVYVQGVDFNCKYYNYATKETTDIPTVIEPGNGSVWFTTYGCTGRLTGYDGRIIDYCVTKKPITADMITVTYNNNEPAVTVKNGDLTLVEGQDYTLTTSDGEETGTTDVTVTATTSSTHYEGSATKTVKSPIISKNYSIKFDANGGTGTMEDLPMVYDAEKALTANTFTKEDHTFTGWNTKADGSGTAYTDEQVISNLTDTNEDIITLYAQWTPTQAQKEITIDEIPAQAYTGKAIEPPLTVKSDGILLTIDQDYDVEYADNINPGTAKATVTFKGEYDGTEAKTVQFTIKSSFKAKSLWVSKHESTYVTFNWTGAPNNSLATAWDVQYRTKQIGTQYAWSKWTSSRESGKTLSKRVYLKPNYTIEFKVKHETDTAYLRSVFTTPAGGKYQSITQCRVKVTTTASGALYRQGTKTLALKTGVNFSGDTGNIIYIKKGTSIKVTPNHVYPRSNYSKYPRLYPNHAWYDISDSTVASLTGKASTAGMKDSAVTIKGLKMGTTTVKITSCNGRGATLTIVVK